MKSVLEHYEFTKRLSRKKELKDWSNSKVKLFEGDNVFSNLLVKTRQLIEKFYIGF
jgi:type I restriction enzyme R subunit